jgi:sortase B
MANDNKMPVLASITEASSVNEKSIAGTVKNISVKAGLIIAILIFGSIALVTTLVVVVHMSNLRASSAEYDSLREIAGDLYADSSAGHIQHLSALDEEMLQINPDYICWIRIDGTNIDYPVVRGSDNERYLKTSFNGSYNIAGTIFMDYRNVGNLFFYSISESLPHIILYGHNLQQGGMFTDLRRFLNEQFLELNDIIVLTVNDREIRYRIFAARLTDIEDPAYYLDFSVSRYFRRFADRIDAPIAATQILTLSTCVREGSDDSRIIVQAYRLFD